MTTLKNTSITEYSNASESNFTHVTTHLDGTFNYIYIYVCTSLVIIGIIGNIISLQVFMRSGRCQPIIIQRHSLILLTLTNTIYLLNFSYFKIVPKLLESNMFNQSTIHFFENIYVMDTSVYSCKIVMYLLNAATCLNSFITTSFSLERAFVIKFPYLGINLRENHHKHFRILGFFLFAFSLIMPSYTLFLADICIINNDSEPITRCNIPPEYQVLYFNMTVFFVLCTNLVPSVFIAISNLTIIHEIIKNSRNEVQRTLRIEENIKFFSTCQRTDLETPDINELDTKIIPLIEYSHIESSNYNQSIISQKENSSNHSHNNHHNIYKRASSSIVHSNHLATKMLIAISISFLVLNVPYFVTWCVYTYNRSGPLDYRKELYRYVKITEIFFLVNYSIAGYLYFASGKMYREHLYAILGCTFRRKRLSLSRGTS